MKISDQKLNKRMNHFEKVCHDSGFKLTHQRMEIFREVAKADDHPDAENIYRRIRKKLPTISLDTVYRTLWLLKDLGMITTLGSEQHRTRFDANLDHHHHFVCIVCGMTLDFYSEELDRVKLPESIDSIGIVQMAQVEVRGVCHRCAINAEKVKK